MSVAGLWAVALAPIIGSFLGVVIQRLPNNRPIVLARSCCDHCGTPLRSWAMMPLLSYVALRGLCLDCGRSIGRFHPMVELAAILVAIWVVMTVPRDATMIWAGCGLGWSLLTLSWIDARHFWLPDAITLPLLLAGLLMVGLCFPDALWDHALGSLAGWAGLRIVALAYRLWRHRDGLGGGDAKLFAAGGAWLGLRMLPDVLLIAAGTGLLFAMIARLRGRTFTRTTALSFGPFLALSIWLTWIYGPRLGGPCSNNATDASSIRAL